ncbi:hypothetical protein [Shewanella psychrotolerans]|nr:hypothetical protein [Shewanella psychrotolerans]
MLQRTEFNEDDACCEDECRAELNLLVALDAARLHCRIESFS